MGYGEQRSDNRFQEDDPLGPNVPAGLPPVDVNVNFYAHRMSRSGSSRSIVMGSRSITSSSGSRSTGGSVHSIGQDPGSSVQVHYSHKVILNFITYRPKVSQIFVVLPVSKNFHLAARNNNKVQR